MRFKIKLVFVSAFFILVTVYFLKCLSITDNGSLTKDDFKNFDNTVGSPTPLVPDIIHFIQFDQQEISFIHFICMCSAFYNHASSFIYLHTNVKVLRGKYFNLLKKLFGKVLIVKYLEKPSHVYGQRLSSVQHSADVARIKILMEYGGIVLDQDVFVVRNLNRFRHFEVAIGWPKGQNIGTQVIVAHKDARFLPQYLALYQDYKPNLWYYNAGEAPTSLILNKNPGLVHRVTTEFGVENLSEQLYGRHWPAWSQRYTIHLLDGHKQYLMNISEFQENNYKKCDCTVSDMIHSIVSVLKLDGIHLGAKQNQNDDQILNFIAGDSKSLLHKYLTKDVFDYLREEITDDYKTNLHDVIQSGLSHPDSNLGLYAPDPDSYQVFKKLFYPVIRDYHKIKTKNIQQPLSDWDDKFHSLGNFNQTYVKSTRIRIARNIRGFPFNSKMTKSDYLSLEKLVQPVLESLTGELSGSYRSLLEMTPVDHEKLVSEHLMFGECDQYLLDAGACAHWPYGRGVFINHDKTFVVWIGEEDHLRIISIEQGGNLASVFQRLGKAVHLLESKLSFVHNSELGYLTFCPSNLGTTLRASVHLNLPKLYKTKSIDEIRNHIDQENLGLQVRGSGGEHTETEGELRDFSNSRRLGKSELELVKGVFKGVNKLIEWEHNI